MFRKATAFLGTFNYFHGGITLGSFSSDGTLYTAEVESLPQHFPLGGIVQKGMVVTAWWTTDTQEHVVKVESESWDPLEFSLNTPIIFMGSSTYNMKSTLTAMSIRGDICTAIPADGQILKSTVTPLDMCVVAGSTLGSILAIAGGNGGVRIYNQEAGMLETCRIYPSGPHKSVISMELSKVGDTYRLITACRDGFLRVYEVPWCSAHSRATKLLLPCLQEEKCIKIPNWIMDIGKIQVHKSRIIIQDSDRSSLSIIEMTNEEEIFKIDKIPRIIATTILHDDLFVTSNAGTNTYELQPFPKKYKFNKIRSLLD